MRCRRCIDDLETLYSNDILLWDGLKASAMYNQDWLFCWCLQVSAYITLDCPPLAYLAVLSSCR